MNRYQTISFDTKKKEGREGLHNMIDILTRNDYIVVVRYEDCDIVCLDYNYSNKSWGFPRPYWLTPKEEETVKYEDRDENRDEG